MRSQSPELLVFVEKLSSFFSVENSIPPGMARVLAYLLVCQPAHQSANQIAIDLQLSSGAVSNAVSMLQQIGLIRRVTFTGDRKYYYESDPLAWRQTVYQRLKSVRHGITLADEGIRLADPNPRLEAMRTIYQLFETGAEELLRKLDE
jgi:DNA-binding Lrp family transcriptional regulator